VQRNNMDIEEIMQDVNSLIHNYDAGIGIKFVKKDEQGLHMEVLIFNLDKFLGLSEISNIIKRALKPYNLTLVSLKLKK